MHHDANTDITALPLEALNIRTDCALRFDVDAPYLHAELIGIDRPVVWVGPDGYEVAHRIEWGPTTGEVAVLPTADFGGAERVHVFAGGGASFANTNFSVLPSDTIVSCVNDSEPRVTSMTIVVDTSKGSSDLQDIAIPLRDDVAYDMEVLWNPGTTPSFAETTRVDGQLDPAVIEGVELSPFRPLQHTYDDVYRGEIKIAGRMPRWAYANQPDAISGTAVSRKDAIVAVERWADLEWTNFQEAFFGCAELITTGAGVFFDQGAQQWFADQLIEGYRPAPVGSMRDCFRGCTSYGSIGDACGIGAWDVSNVTSIREAFRDAVVFNQDIGAWDVSGIGNMFGAFWDASSFDVDLSEWDMSHGPSIDRMFQLASSYTNAGEPLDGQGHSDPANTGWDVSSITTMVELFRGTPYNESLEAWDVGNVVSMERMFNGASYNQPLNGWDTSSLQNISFMFDGGASYNQPLNSWDTSSLSNARVAFAFGAFDQDIGSWDISGLTNATRMFRDGSMSRDPAGDGTQNGNLDKTLIGWAAQTVQSGTRLGVDVSSFSQLSDDGEQAALDLCAQGWQLEDNNDSNICP